MKRRLFRGLSLCVLLQLGQHLAFGWDYEIHRLINQMALTSLPTNFPAFVRTPEATDRIGFLAGEPDRWRNVQDLPLKHGSGPDHYIDIEQLADYGLKPESLSNLRYQFVGELAVFLKAHPEKFPEVNSPRNEDHTRELVGLLPWAITENYSKLKSCFSYLKTYQEGGTPEEIANAQANIIYVMGTMGHYLGDASQPLHSTIHHHGWVGDNPQHYTTSTRFHSWIDSGFFDKIGGPNRKALVATIRPAHAVSFDNREAKPAEMFSVALAFVIEQNKLVEPLYQLEKDGKLSGEGEAGAQGRPFMEAQLLKSAQLLGDVWFSAWQQAGTDGFLKGQLERRKHDNAKPSQP